MPEALDQDTTTISSEQDADSVLDGIQSSESGGPIQDAPQSQTPVDEFDLTVGGKSIKAKRDQVMQWAQMGYDAPNKIRNLTKEIDGWKSKWSEAEPKWKEIENKYGEIDGYVRQNPKFWDHVVNSYQQLNQGIQDSSNPLAGLVQQLQQKLDAHDQKITAYEQRVAQERIQQEDQAYQNVLGEMKKSYPDIDFDSPDNEGKSLEYKVIEHAQANGIRDFKTAFRDFYHDQLLMRAESKAKESLTKEKQKNTKLGILGITPTPVKRSTTANIREKSYDDLGREALEELGIS